MERAAEATEKSLDVRFSIGFAVGDDGAFPTSFPDSPAARAGVPPGSKLVAVNGRRWTRDILRDALQASATTPIELLVETGDVFSTYRLDYSGRRALSAPRAGRRRGRTSSRESSAPARPVDSPDREVTAPWQ